MNKYPDTTSVVSHYQNRRNNYGGGQVLSVGHDCESSLEYCGSEKIHGGEI